MFGRMKLTAKLLGGFGVVVLITLAVGITGVIVSNDLSALAQRLSNQDLSEVRLVAGLSSQANAYRRAQLQHVLAVTAESKAQQEKRLGFAEKGANEALTTYLRTASAAEAKTLATDVKTLWSSFAAETPTILALSRQGRAAEAQALLNAKSQDLFQQIEDKLARLDQFHEADGKAIVEETDRLNKLSRTLLLSVALFGALMGAGLALTLSRAIVSPLKTLAGAAHALAEGDLSVPPLEVKTTDEVGELAKSLNRMRENLRDTVKEIGATARQVAATSEELTATADTAARATTDITAAVAKTVGEAEQGSLAQQASVEQASSVVLQLDEAIQQIARGAQDQAKSVTQTSSVLGQVASAVQEVAATAQNLAASSTQTSAAAEKGGVSVEKTVAGMERITRVVNESADRIREMGSYSKQIGQIVEVISELASQTNLLALNAAIEAARAGEHGKGFAVVADAVRSLAERSSQATKEIGALISNIQSATENAVRAMEAGTTEVEEGTALSREAGAALAEILKTVEQTHREIQSISSATEEIAASSTEAVKAMDDVAAVTEESTAATQQMAAGSSTVRKAVADISAVSTQSASAIKNAGASTEEMSAAVEEVASSASSLSTLAQEMQRLVGKFKL